MGAKQTTISSVPKAEAQCNQDELKIPGKMAARRINELQAGQQQGELANSEEDGSKCQFQSLILCPPDLVKATWF